MAADVPLIPITMLEAGTPQGTDVIPGVDTTDPTMALAGTTKKYEQADILTWMLGLYGYNTITPCDLATTANLTATYANGTLGVGATLTNAGAQAALTIDGVAATINDRIVVKNQASTFQNGIYLVQSIGSSSSNWVLIRDPAFNQTAEVLNNMPVFVKYGTTNNNTMWRTSVTVPVVMGTDPILFVVFTTISSVIVLPVPLADGGTSASLTATAGAITYSTASAMAFSGVGQSGQVFQSGGTGTPTWSTPTYPSLSGTLGQFIQSNGTNNLYSSYTLPTIVPTVGKILRSDGTNMVGTTATFADTYAINTILYAGTANAVSGLATANDSVLVTNGSGVPSWSTTLPSGIVISGYLPLTGGTMSGDIDMGSQQITNMADPTLAQDAATKNYVDTVAAAFAVTFVARLASTTALTVSYNNGTAGVGATLTNAGAMAAFSLDGVSANLNDLVLIKNQASTFENGYYQVTTVGSGAANWVLTRTATYDTPTEIQPGDIFVITSGSTQAQTTWIQTATVATIGTDAISFSQYTVAIPVPVSQGGTGATTAPNARTNLSAAELGANADITSMTGLTGALRAPTFILDSNGNEVLGFTGVASAVNYIDISNNATGQSPSIIVLGSDTDINMQFGVKGNGSYAFRGNTSTQTRFQFYENETNGTHSLQLRAPSALANDLTIYEFQETAQTGYVAWDQTSTPAWTNWTPTFTGFSVAPVINQCRYKKIGKTCFVQLSMGSGTSNATTFTITNLPFTSFAGDAITSLFEGTNNNIEVYSIVGVVAPSSTTLTLLLNGNSAGWTAALGKRFLGQFYYETA